MSPTADTDQLWRMTMQHSPVGMALVSPEGRWLAVNDALCVMFGHDSEALLRMTFQQITHPEDLASDLALLEETLAGERSSYRITKRYLRADGAVAWGDLSVTLVRDDDGEPLHFISQILDVTQQHLYETRLAAAHAATERERRVADALLDSVDVGLVLLDASGRYERMNRRHEEFMALAFPDGHAGMAGQLGEVFAEDRTTLLTREQMPTRRALAGEEFDALTLWTGADPATRRAIAVSARLVRDPAGAVEWVALAYHDVTELMQALAVKDDFVALVSHELRTPLASVLGHLEMFAERADLPTGADRQIAVMERNALRLRRLVNDLLLVAQDGLAIHRREVDLARVVSDVVEATRLVADQAGIDLVLEAPDSLRAEVDEERLRQVADNLVSNAVKYTERGGTVRVAVTRTDDDVQLVVADDGLGVDPGEVEQLFNRFFRGQEAQRRQIPGTGLGLNIVRQIAEAHGGTATMTSEPGVGSTVTVVLPEVAIG